MTEPRPVTLFYSYSHKDEGLKKELQSHIATLSKQEIVTEWHDRLILPGRKWESEIDSNIDNADIIILLISPDFIASDYCYGKELKRALERHAEDSCLVVPVIIRPVDWNMAPFANLQALPTDGRPVTTWNNRDEAFLDITRGLRILVNELRISKDRHAGKKAIFKIKELLVDEFKRVEATYDNKREPWMTTGIASVDDFLGGIHPRDVILIGAKDSSVNTDFMTSIALHIAGTSKRCALLISLAATLEEIMMRLVVSKSRVPRRRYWRGFLGKSDWPNLSSAAGFLAEAPLHVFAAQDMTDVQLLESVRELRKTENLEVVLIDGVDFISSSHTYHDSRGEIRAIVRAVRKIAFEEGVTVIATSTATPPPRAKPDRRPTVSDLEEMELLASSVAAVVGFLHVSEDQRSETETDQVVELNIKKNAHGRLARILISYSKETGAFEEYKPD